MTSAAPGSVRGQGRSEFGVALFLIAVGFVTFLGLWAAIERTRLGMRIRAAVDNRAMAEAVGVDVGAEHLHRAGARPFQP